MIVTNLLLVTPSILLMSVANVLIKQRVTLLDQLNSSKSLSRILSYLFDPIVLLSCVLVGASVLWWLSVCSRVQVSTVYPLFQGGVIALTALLAVSFLGESLTLQSCLSIALILAGVIMLQTN